MPKKPDIKIVPDKAGGDALSNADLAAFQLSTLRAELAQSRAEAADLRCRLRHESAQLGEIRIKAAYKQQRDEADGLKQQADAALAAAVEQHKAFGAELATRYRFDKDRVAIEPLTGAIVPLPK